MKASVLVAWAGTKPGKGSRAGSSSDDYPTLKLGNGAKALLSNQCFCVKKFCLIIATNHFCRALCPAGTAVLALLAVCAVANGDDALASNQRDLKQFGFSGSQSQAQAQAQSGEWCCWRSQPAFVPLQSWLLHAGSMCRDASTQRTLHFFACTHVYSLFFSLHAAASLPNSWRRLWWEWLSSTGPGAVTVK